MPCRLLVHLVAALASSATLLHAQTKFVTGINVVRIDVSVTDRNGAPVKGLTKDDFRIIEDDKPAEIVAFEAVNIPAPEPPTPGVAAWVTDHRRDVVSNRVDERRLVMIVMDDATMPLDPAMMNAARKLGHDVIAGLGESDRAAVVFTSDNRFSQDFTTDKSRLNAAIDKMNGGKVLVSLEGTGDWFFMQAATRTLSNAIELLKASPQGRKAIVYISTGVPIDIDAAEPKAITGAFSMAGHEAALRVQDEVRSALTSAALAEVAVYAFDPGGLGGLEDYVTQFYVRNRVPLAQATEQGRRYANLSADFLEGQAEASGGLAVIRTNDYSRGITKMFDALSNFYLIGFSTAASKAGNHSLEVLTSRPDLIVRSRGKFQTGTVPKNVRPNDSTTAKGMGLTKAMTAALPEGNLPMRVAAAPFAGFADQHPVAISLGIHQPKTAGLASTTVMTRVNAYSIDGKYVTGKKVEATLKLRPTEIDALQYEVLSSLKLRPGRYQLRLGAEITESGLSGSVFADVEVPDFVKDPISMSGLALTMTPSTTAAPVDAFKDIAPVFTSHRVFDATNTVSVLAKVYQGGRGALADIPVTARVMNARDRVVYSRKETLAAGQFKLRTADYNAAIPVAAFDPGEYLLVIEASLPSGKLARRELRFTRR